MIREANFHQSQLFMKYHTSQSENSIRVTEALQRRIQWETTHRMEKEEQQKPRESSEERIWRGNQSWLLWVWIIFIFISLSVVHTHTKKKWWEKFLCYASCPGLEVAVSQRMSGNLVLHVLTGMMNMLSLADSFSAQKSQDCIVVGGGNHE